MLESQPTTSAHMWCAYVGRRYVGIHACCLQDPPMTCVVLSQDRLELIADLQLLANIQTLVLQVIDLILLYEGDVMKFAGDSMIVAFSPSNEEKGADDGGLKEATLRCMHCASDLVDKYGKPACLCHTDHSLPASCSLT